MASLTLSPRSAAAPPLRAASLFWLAVAATFLVHFLPFGHLIGRPLVWFATLVHELGHGVTALLVGGDFGPFRMWPDGSGVASVATTGALASAAVAAGGLAGPSLAATLGFAAAGRARLARGFLGALALVFLWALVLHARTLFAAGFLAVVVVLLGGVALLASARAAQLLLMFLSVQLALSLWSDLDYMFAATAETGAGTGRSDTAAIAAALGGPYWLWGAACAALSLAALALGAWIVLRDRR